MTALDALLAALDEAAWLGFGVLAFGGATAIAAVLFELLVER